jgi:hypothetical protein
MAKPGSLKWMALGCVLPVALHWAAPTCAAAQDTVPSARVPDVTVPYSTPWQFSFTPYVWAASQKGRIGVDGSVTDVDLSFSDIFNGVDLGFSGRFEARRKRWIISVDFQWVSLSDDEAVPEDGAAETVQASFDQVITQPEVGYTLLVRPWGGLDGLAGVRYWHMNADIGASEGGAQVAQASGSQDWVDGTVGALLRFRPAPKWHFWAKGDIGGGGSQFTWQAHGGVGYDVGHCCTGVALYRHLDVDYESGDFINDVYMTGPALGFELRF